MVIYALVGKGALVGRCRICYIERQATPTRRGITASVGSCCRAVTALAPVWAFASDLNLPHVWEISGAFVQPARRHGPPLGLILLEAAGFTMCEAGAGFAMGALLGFVLAIVFAHSPLLERSLVPYVVASQTVPILAIAPMVVVWLQAGWWSVAIIGELPSGIRDGLGGAILNFNQYYIGITFYLVILLVERWVIPWHASLRGSEE